MKKPSERVNEIVAAQAVIQGLGTENMGMSREARLSVDAILKVLDEMWDNGQLVKHS